MRREEKVDTDKRKSSRFVLEEPTDNEEVFRKEKKKERKRERKKGRKRERKKGR